MKELKEPTPVLYEFSGFRLDPERRALLRHGEPVVLTRKGFEVLLFLVQNRERILEKDELMKSLWPESFVEESNLMSLITDLPTLLCGTRLERKS